MARTDSVIATVAVGNGPSALCCNRENDKVYCASAGGSVAVLHCATNIRRAVVTVGDKPYALCYNSQYNKVYCANYHGDNVAVLDGADKPGRLPRCWSGTIQMPSAIILRTTKVYCANSGSRDVTVIDGVTDSSSPRCPPELRLCPLP